MHYEYTHFFCYYLTGHYNVNRFTMNYDAKRIVHVSENLLMYRLISATKCQVKLKEGLLFSTSDDDDDHSCVELITVTSI